MVEPAEKADPGLDENQSGQPERRLQHSHFSESAVREPARTICVVGLGYIGLPTASLLASRGHMVHGVDICEKVVDVINAGDIHIREPELDVMVRSAVESKRLKASLKPVAAEVFILAVPTPFKGDHEPDLSYVEAATRSIAPVLKRGDLVILESTSPVGTTEKVAEWLAEERPDLARDKSSAELNSCPGLRIAHCPERVLPGHIMRELVENDRIVGGIDEASTEAAVAFYRNFVSGKILKTDSRTAEMAKLTENTFRDVNIALANELAALCDHWEIDPWRLIELANHHPRVNILNPGPGVGGHCIAVDPWFIVSAQPERAQLIRTARQINAERPGQVVRSVLEAVKGHDNPVIACFGLAYKPDIDDLRESPALEITVRLAHSGIESLLVVEPNISQLPVELAGSDKVKLTDAQSAMAAADILVMLVDHQEFRKISPSIRDGQKLIDTRGIWGQTE